MCQTKGQGKEEKTKCEIFSNGDFSSDIWENGIISIDHMMPTGKELENVIKEFYLATLEMEQE